MIAYDLRLEENKSLTELLAHCFHRYETNYPKLSIAASASSQHALVSLASASQSTSNSGQSTSNSGQQQYVQRGSSSGNRQNNNNNPQVCPFCNKKGHSIDNCYSLTKAKKYLSG